MTKLTSPTDGTTTFAYDGAGGRGNKDGNGLTQYGLLSSKTEGNGNYESYDYDSCNQQISTGYWWADGTGQNALVYSYDPAGNVHSVNQGWYATTYGYDGADQLTSETNANGSSSAPPTLGYTYDHNGNRLTQTQNGSSYQSFSYDAHDKLTSGTAGSESDGYDQNGNETSISINGGVYRLVYDDEDRLTSLTLPSGTMDSFTYNGLGLRVGKTDSTGSYAYLCDGTSPASPVLTDGAALYTPGLSENRGGASRYYSNDLLGNLWTIDGSAKSQAYYQDTTGFGTLVAQAGSGSPFGYGGGNGCQTDADTGLILMGHRYYDTRIGRFISQDPAGMGKNWYAYAGNNPTNNTDPLGLWINSPVPEDGDPDDNKLITDAVNAGAQPGEEYDLRQGSATGPIIKTFTIPAGSVLSWNGFHILVPPGVSLANNISRAAKQGHWNPFVAIWFYNQVRNNKDRHLPLTGPDASWDYKQLNGAYAAFGNFDYGASGASIADQNVWTEDTILRAAGFAQTRAQTSQPGWGSPLGAAPYGDDPADQSLIRAGWSYYQKHPVSDDWP